MKYAIGIDVGKSGAGVIQDLESGNIVKFTMPIIGKEFDVHELCRILEPFKGTDCMIVFEDLRAIFGSSSKSTFTFGFVAGATEAAIISLGLPYRKVNAKVWQKLAFLGVPEIREPDKVTATGRKIKGKLKTKEMALIAAKRLYPNFDLRASERAKNPHDGIVDALLMSWFCKQTYK